MNKPKKTHPWRVWVPAKPEQPGYTYVPRIPVHARMGLK